MIWASGLYSKPEAEIQLTVMRAGSRAKNRTEGSSLHVQREPLTQSSFWLQAAGSMALFESGSASCQHSSQCLLPAGWGSRARQSLVPTAVLGSPSWTLVWTWVPPHSRLGSVWPTQLLRWQCYCLYQGNRNKNYTSGKEVQRSSEVRTKQTSNHL